jgi:hypothetical protein
MTLSTRAIGAMIVASLAVGILALSHPARASQTADPAESTLNLLPTSESNTVYIAAETTEIGSVPFYAPNGRVALRVLMRLQLSRATS